MKDYVLMNRLVILIIHRYLLIIVYCKGGHGYSVGSLGKGASFSVISDIKMTRMTCEDCYAVAQIKVCKGCLSVGSYHVTCWTNFTYHA